jgi:hypothetical protein
VKNFVGAFIGIIIGSFIIIILIPISQPMYPPPYDSLWILFAGCEALQITGQNLLANNNVLWYIIAWFLMGIVTSPVSDSRWNAVRTAIWIGVFMTLFSLGSILLLDPTFWLSETRNWELLIQLITSILTSFLSLISSIPLLMLSVKIREKSEPPVPDKIETICECGAVFKSRPMICAECGKVLYDIESE